MWLVASIAGMVGALLATGVVAAAGGLTNKHTERVVEREEVAARTVSTPGQSVVDIAQRVRPACKMCRAASPNLLFHIQPLHSLRCALSTRMR